MVGSIPTNGSRLSKAKTKRRPQMAFNTIYKHLAETIRDEKAKDAVSTRAQQTLDDLALAFAEKMEPRQPGSFNKAKFLEMAGVKGVE
jgi:hypothetical protein